MSLDCLPFSFLLKETKIPDWKVFLPSYRLVFWYMYISIFVYNVYACICPMYISIFVYNVICITYMYIYILCVQSRKLPRDAATRCTQLAHAMRSSRIRGCTLHSLVRHSLRPIKRNVSDYFIPRFLEPQWSILESRRRRTARRQIKALYKACTAR